MTVYSILIMLLSRLFCIVVLLVSPIATIRGTDTAASDTINPYKIITPEEKRFRVNFAEPNLQWNPQYAYSTVEGQIYTALYEGLTIYHPATLEPMPGVAESWKVSEDRLEVTFKIRKDAKWSNGEKITSTDFRKSWEKLLSPETNSDFASMLDDIQGVQDYRTAQADSSALGIFSPEPETLVLKLRRPSPHLFSILCHYSFVPVHRDFRNIRNWDAIRSVPVNGPYTILARTENKILLNKNPLYWDRDSVAIDGIEISFSDDSVELVESFNRFQIDWIISGISDSGQITTPESLNIGPLFSTSYYYFNNSNVWSQAKIRRAIALIIPWEDLRKNAIIPGTTLVPPIPNYPRASQNFPPEIERLEEARKLLDEAGYPLGAGLPPMRIRIVKEDESIKIIRKALKDTINLQTELQIVDFLDYYDSLQDGNYDLAHVAWTGDYADPFSFLGMWATGSSFNNAGYSNPEYDSILEKASTLPFLERYSKLKKAEEILLHSAQVLPVEHYPSWNIIDRRFVMGWFENALDIHPFKDIRRSPGFEIPGLAMKN